VLAGTRAHPHRHLPALHPPAPAHRGPATPAPRPRHSNHRGSPPPAHTRAPESGHRATRLARHWQVVVVVAERLFTIPITCHVDRRAHEVTDENTAAGRRTGHYKALCGYRVIAAAMAAPVGRPCPEYTAVLVPSRPLRDRPTPGVTATRGGRGGSCTSAASPGAGTCDTPRGRAGSPAPRLSRPPGSKQRKNNEGLSRRWSRGVARCRVGVVTHEG
jgi:hypothetical protein